MKSKKKVVILAEIQVKSLMDKLRVERNHRIIEEILNQPKELSKELKSYK